jgi:hypothetical protein
VSRFADQILGQRFSSSGAPIGANFPVTPGAGTVLHPKVASDSGGNFVVVFTDSDGYGNGVFGQRFSSAGAPLGSEFQINTYTTNSQIEPVVASDGSGNFVVVWYDQVQGGGGDFGRRYASTGGPLTGEFRIDTSGTAARFLPTVASDAAGNFVAAWTRLDGNTIGVSARLFSSTGAPIGTGFAVNSYTFNVQSFPAIALASSGGKFAITWSSGFQDNSESAVYARRFGTGTACTSGDVNWDGKRDVSDVFYLINTLFAGGPPSLCSGDVDASGAVDVLDVFYLINYLFAGGPAPM